MILRHNLAGWGVPLACLMLLGCQTTPGAAGRGRNGHGAMQCLQRSVSFPDNTVVRVAAVEALESTGRNDVKPWIRTALADRQPAVRFAACLAVGRLLDESAKAAVNGLVDDPDPSVRLAALFALHRLGDTSRSGHMPAYLLDHPEPMVRRNAALVFGLMDEPGAIKLLARAMKDSDPGVRQHALEAMARLGQEDAQQELTFMANAGVGSDEVFALNALGATGKRQFADLYQYKLDTGLHVETRLAAARALGRIGKPQGFQEAISALRSPTPRQNDRDDPPQAQRLRMRQMAAAALGAIGRREALPTLQDELAREDDERVRVSLARAILEIEGPRRGLGFPQVADKKRK